jgi:hypothetical protein
MRRRHPVHPRQGRPQIRYDSRYGHRADPPPDCALCASHSATTSGEGGREREREEVAAGTRAAESQRRGLAGPTLSPGVGWGIAGAALRRGHGAGG